MKWQMQKIADEGTSEPYIARLWLGVMQMRDLVVRHVAADDHDFEARRRHFDDLYSPVLDAMASTRNNGRRVQDLIRNHRAKLRDRSIVGYQANAVEIHESIAAPLQEAFSNLVSTAVRATKLLQDVLKYLDLDIGFVFAKQVNYQAGLAKLKQGGDTALADYLAATRLGWSDKLINKRNDLEHKGWRLPDVRYRRGPDGHPEMVEPECDGMPVSEWTATMLPHVLSFVEEMIAYSVQRRLGPDAGLAEVPPDKRDPQNPQRFYFTVPTIQKEAQLWTLRYSSCGFPD